MSWSGLPERIEQKIIPEPNSGCWLWTAGLRDNSEGYGAVRYAMKTWRSHKLVYTLLREKVPEGLTLDHNCRNRICCNPDHLTPRTWKDNILRGEGVAAKNKVKTHCKRGHEFTIENTYTGPPNGYQIRSCQSCLRMHRTAYEIRKKAKI